MVSLRSLARFCGISENDTEPIRTSGDAKSGYPMTGDRKKRKLHMPLSLRMDQPLQQCI
jgi:hypothetical protein